LREVGDRAADGDIGMFCAGEPGRHHVAGVDGEFIRDRIGNSREVCLGAVDVEIFGEDAFLDVGEFPAAEHLGALRGESAHAVLALVAGRDRVDRNAVAFLDAGDFAADAVDDADGFVSEREVVPFTDRALDGVGVGGEVQTIARVVLTMAPLGPGSVGRGFSEKPTALIRSMTKACMESDMGGLLPARCLLSP
jgi:hypothetical protein